MLAALVLGTYGLAINDEQDQVSALHNLADGSLEVREHPEQYYRAKDGMHKVVRFPGEQPVGSTLLNYFAIPSLLVVRAADEVAPLGVWTAAAALVLGWSLQPSSRRRPVGLWLAGAGMLLLTSGFRFDPIDIDLVGPLVALQFTNVLFLGVTAAFLAAIIDRHVEGQGKTIAVTAVLIGPLVYWGSRLKYGMLAATLVATTLWLVGEPPSARRNLAVGVVVALAIWNNVGEGVILLGATAGWFAYETVRTRAWSLTRLMLPIAGLAIGLIPWALENQALRGNPFAASYLVPIDGSPPTGSGVLHVLSLAFASDIWHGPTDFLANLLGQWTTGWRMESHPLGVFAISPLLALGLWTVCRTRWWRRSDHFLAIAFIVLHVAMLTNRVVRHGWGPDARLLLPTLPAVGVLAAPAIARLTERAGVRADSTAVLVGLGWAAIGLALFGFIGVIFDQGLRNPEVNRVLYWAWALLSVAVMMNIILLQWSRIVSWGRPLVPIAVGILLSMPILWIGLTSVVASTGAPVADAGTDETVGAFIPLVDDLRNVLAPRLFPYGPLPIVTDELGRVVFHPDYGYCAVEPSPCPWWDSTNATSSAEF